MPHLTVHVLEDQLAGRESALIASLTEAVVDVYGEWARSIAVVQLVGVPAGRWGVGGRVAAEAGPAVTFGVRAVAFDRPDSGDLLARLAAGVTDAVASVLGEAVRQNVTVEFVGTPDGRTAVGGAIVTPPTTVVP